MTKIPYKFLRQSASPVLHVLKWMGFRKTVLRLDVGNWFGLPWNEIFKSSLWMRLRYEIKSVHFGDIRQAGEPVSLKVSVDDYVGKTYDGYRLWELCRTGILASLEVPVLGSEPNDRELQVIQFYYEQAARALDGSRKLLEKIQPLSVVTVQGTNPMARPLIEVARDLNISVVGVEGCFSSEYFFCDDSTGIILNRHRAANQDGHWLESRGLSEKERADFHCLLKEARENKREEHQTGSDSAPLSIREQLRISSDVKIAVFIGQVLTDAAIILDSTVYPDPTDAIRDVVRYFEDKPDWFLIIRLHPKEDGGSSWVNRADVQNGYGTPSGESAGPLPYERATFRRLLMKGVEERTDRHVVVYDRSISTEAVFQEAELGITITSQAGLEFAFHHKRLVTCGDAFYRGKGFTLDVSHPKALAPLLDEAISNLTLDEEEIFRIDRFGDHMLRRVLFRKDLEGCRERLFRTILGLSHT